MGSHPINLAARFLLEIAGLVALAMLGWFYGKGVYKYLLAPTLPLVAAVCWGIFAVPGDPARSGEAVVQIPGIVRLLLELAFFASATWSLFIAGKPILGWVYGVAVLVHYLASHDRIQWLIHQ
jgi:hypothetical protein